MRRVVLVVGLAAGLAVPGQAAAQGFGIGPRISFVRGNVVTDEPSSRFVGGTMRMGSKHAALELSLDYRSYRNLDNTVRVRETPIQGSVLIFPVRKVVAPYLLGGAGLYGRTYQTLGPLGEVVATTSTERKFGVHLGLGAEFFLGRHVAIFADYRYRFVRFGTPAADDQPINIPGSSVIPGLDKVKISHQGSMWTTGVTFYF
jgi:hypothetical protein